MQKGMIKIWCNDYKDAMFKAFISTLLLDSKNYHKVNDPRHANLWCLVCLEDDKDNMVELYHSLSNKPKVIYLRRSFIAPPVPQWVFFKTPLHASALINWVKAQNYADTGYNKPPAKPIDIADHDPVAVQERWRHEPFKLQYWPNITQYSDSPDIVAVCIPLLQSWLTYDSLPETNLPDAILDKMLKDAHEEGNIAYLHDNSISDNDTQDNSKADTKHLQTQTSSPASLPQHQHQNSSDAIAKKASKKKHDKGWGFFKSLYNRFVN